MLLVLLLVGLVAYRPATMLGVDGDSLAGSIEGGGRCDEEREGAWQCSTLDVSASGTIYWAVKTRAFGCCDAWRAQRLDRRKGDADRSRCISVFDGLLGHRLND